MKKNYFSYVYKRVLVGVLLGIVVFVSSALYMKSLYYESIESGLRGIESALQYYTEQYSQAQMGKDEIKDALGNYNVDYIRIMKVLDNGSYDTLFETDYNTIHVNSGSNYVYYITEDEHLPAKDLMTVISEDDYTTVAYRKCDEIKEVVKDHVPEISSTAEIINQSGVFNIGNKVFKSASEFNLNSRSPVLVVETSYEDGEYLHLGKVYESNRKGEKLLFGKRWDYTEENKKDLYKDKMADNYIFVYGSGTAPDGFSIKYIRTFVSNICCLNKRPDKFFEETGKLFFTENDKDFYEYRKYDPAFLDFNADGNYSVEIKTGGGRTSYGSLKRVPFFDDEYIIEFVVTYVSFEEYFMPVLIVYAIVLLILCAGIPCLSGIGSYRKLKKTSNADPEKAEQDNALAVDLKPQLRDIGILAKEIIDTEDEQTKNDDYTKILGKLTELDIGIDELAKRAKRG